MITFQEIYNISMLFDRQEMQKQKITGKKSYFCGTKSSFLLDIVYAFPDGPLVIFSKFDVIQDFVVSYTVIITYLSIE